MEWFLETVVVPKWGRKNIEHYVQKMETEKLETVVVIRTNFEH